MRGAMPGVSTPIPITLSEQIFCAVVLISFPISIVCWVIAWFKSGRRGIFFNRALTPDAARYRAVGLIFWLISVASACIALYLIRNI
jgi:hypothetical protein